MIALGSDHAGYEYKEKIKTLLQELKFSCKDFGTHSKDSTDYPDFAHGVAQAVSSGEYDRGILVCGTGIGMAIVANKHKGVRAAVCESTTAARLARQHNDANILTIGERITGWETAADIVRTFLTTTFEGGRHKPRVEKIHTLTNL
ncbi:MAG: ribose 5-phosphate isomerase B [Ignavibacteriales bacterium]|nr:ribose 5-phosphate isomerase B [Ignavibacteriales bacterium]